MAQKLAEGKWRVQVRAGARRYGGIVYGTQRQAEQREAELKAKYGRRKMKGHAGETVAECLEDWLADWREGDVTPGTLERYQGRIRNMIVPTLGAVKINELTRKDIRRAYQALRKRYAVDTIRDAHNLLRAALDEAVCDDRIVGNPAAGKGLLPRENDRPKRTLPTLADVNATLARLRDTSSGRRCYGPALLALDTGMRVGEVLALKWSDIDLDTGVVYVQRAVQQTSSHGIIIKPPKTRAGERTLLLTRRSQEYLKQHRDDLDALRERLNESDVVDEGWVFPNTSLRRGQVGRMWTPGTFHPLLAKVTKDAGLQLQMHDLRRLHATILEHENVPQTEIAAQLGHSRPDVTRDRYLFAVDDAKQKRVEAFERALEG